MRSKSSWLKQHCTDESEMMTWISCPIRCLIILTTLLGEAMACTSSIYFASAAVPVDSSRMTVSSSEQCHLATRMICWLTKTVSLHRTPVENAGTYQKTSVIQGWLLVWKNRIQGIRDKSKSRDLMNTQGMIWKMYRYLKFASVVQYFYVGTQYSPKIW